MNLSWIPYTNRPISQTRSKAWDFMGQLLVASNSGSSDANVPANLFDEEHLYSKYCFNEQLNAEEFLSSINMSLPSTSTRNWLFHATLKHESKFQKTLSPKITSWLQNRKALHPSLSLTGILL